MARHHYIIYFLFLFFFASCGQVGSISGGPKDTTAPQVLTEEVVPPSKSILISPKEIEIPFKEFIQFQKPAENIRVTPADVQLDYEIKGTSVVLSVKEGEWQANTTYTIYLNRAVKDITEGNDSIISYVFSTGSYLDSLQTGVQIKDAYTGKPVKDITVGLFMETLKTDTSRVVPRYFSVTDKRGIAEFKNIKDTVFYLYAFEDNNINNYLDATEKRAILPGKVKLDTLLRRDSLPKILLMPPPIKKTKVVSSEVLPITRWCIGLNRPLQKKEKLVFLEPQPFHISWNKGKDSLTAYYSTKLNSGQLEALLQTKEEIDTLSERYFFKEPPVLKIKTNLHNNTLYAGDTLQLRLNEPFDFIDTNLISFEVKLKEDSLPSKIKYHLLYSPPNVINLVFNKEKIDSVFLSIFPEGILSQNYKLTDTLQFNFTIQPPKNTGTMIVEIDTIPPYGILFITPKNSSEPPFQIVFDGKTKKSCRLELLQPGKYGFHFLIDKDHNGKWTTGSIFTGKKPEKVRWFSHVTTIRANWEVKSKLNFKKKENVAPKEPKHDKRVAPTR